MIQEFLNTFWSLANDMSPYLLLGFFIAGLLHVFLPKNIYNNHLSKKSFSSVLKATLFGIPLPLCSCGVIPTAMSLRKDGASKGATVSFLTSTPQTGVDSIAATYSLMGLPFAIIRPIAAFFTALMSGFLVNKFDKDDDAPKEEQCEKKSCCFGKSAVIAPITLKDKLKSAFRYGFYDMVKDLAKWIILGILIATVITMFIPDDFFASLSNHPILSMLMVLLLSVPMYLCATGSIPIAMALMLKGLSPGAALVLLMAGPATNAAAILVVYKVLGKRSTLIYLAVLTIGAILFGLGIDYLLPEKWFAISNNLVESCHISDWKYWFGAGSSILLGILMLRTLKPLK